VERNSDEHTETVERAMVAIRRSQNRRTLARLAAARHGARPGGGRGTAADGAAGASADVLDIIEEAEGTGGRGVGGPRGGRGRAPRGGKTWRTRGGGGGGRPSPAWPPP